MRIIKEIPWWNPERGWFFLRYKIPRKIKKKIPKEERIVYWTNWRARKRK